MSIIFDFVCILQKKYKIKPGVRAENRVFGAARAAEQTMCQRGLPGFFINSLPVSLFAFPLYWNTHAIQSITG
jgi:hypothetical protein